MNQISCKQINKVFTGVACLVFLLSPIHAADGPRTNQRSFPWEDSSIESGPDDRSLNSGTYDLGKILALGEQFFSARFTVDDGFGRPESTGNSKPTIRFKQGGARFLRTAGPDAASCAGCHYQPEIGGSGDFVANAFVGAQFTDPPTKSIDTLVTNERNTPSLFGAGLVELLAAEMTEDLWVERSAAEAEATTYGKMIEKQLITKGVSFGAIRALPDGTFDTSEIRGVDRDLVVKPFGAKGVAVSIREFSIFALNHHHGIQAIERFGWTRTGIRDFDGDGIEDEFTPSQVTALALFQAGLPAPRARPIDGDKFQELSRGKALFSDFGCSSCHIERLPLRSIVFSEPNRFNRSGTLQPADNLHKVKFELNQLINGTSVTVDEQGIFWIGIFSDLKRHIICDKEIPHFCNEKIRQDFVPVDEFLTSKLWDVGSSAPYGHRGDLTTITEAILAHGGEGRFSREKFENSTTGEKKALIGFLKTMVVCRRC